MQNYQSFVIKFLFFRLRDIMRSAKLYDDLREVRNGEDYLIHLQAMGRRMHHHTECTDAIVKVSCFIGTKDSTYPATEEQVADFKKVSGIEHCTIEGRSYLTTSMNKETGGIWLAVSYVDGKFDINPISEGYWLCPETKYDTKTIELHY